MLANPTLLEHDQSEHDDAALTYAARRGTGLLPRKAAVLTSSPDPDRAILLDYAAFVLEQEAEYCQQ